MLNTSKRFISTVVDRDRVSSDDVGKERFPYSKIPYPTVLEPEEYKFTEPLCFLHAIANDRKRLMEIYFGPWINKINGILSDSEADFRVYGRITPDFRYKVVKCTVIDEEEKEYFHATKQDLLDMLAKYQQETYASGNYTAIKNATITPSIIETIECPFDDYLGFVPENNSFIVVPKLLHDQLWTKFDDSGSSSSDDDSSSDDSSSSSSSSSSDDGSSSST
jgi:hypothetical protein